MNSGIYQIRNKINGKRYIGQSVDLDKREQGHFNMLKSGTHRNSHLQNSYNKHGKEAFEFKVILYAEPNKLTRYEQELVDKHKPEELYNICLECVDSALGVRRSEETRRKLSVAHTGNHHSEEARRKLSVAHTGKHLSEETKRKMSVAQTGKHLSEEHKRKLSVAHAGKHLSEEHKRKLSVANIGKHHSEETKRKLSVAQTGEKNHNYGKHLSEEARRKLSVAMKKYWRYPGEHIPNRK